MSHPKRVSWEKTIPDVYRCSSQFYHVQLHKLKTKGRFQCKCGYPPLFCTKGCMKRSFKRLSRHYDPHRNHHNRWLKNTNI